MKLEAFWRDFLRETGYAAETPMPEADFFEMDEQGANRLLALVMEGKKTATSSALPAYGPDEPLPCKGMLSIVTDWQGEPWCVIETTGVTILPFREMTFDVARREGEDECLASWRKTHTEFFTRESRQCGYVFNDDTPIVFEDFRVIYRRTESCRAPDA